MAYTAQDYRAWIRSQPHEGYEFVVVDDDHYQLVCDWATGDVQFFVLDDTDDIVQMELIDPAKEEPVFFLHFQVSDQAHVEGLYREMVDALLSLEGSRTTRVLLSCSSALTTTFFAGKLAETARTLGLDYEFSAVGFDRLVEVASDYDVVLLAPQIGYMYDKLAAALGNQLVLLMPTRVFAAYDTMGALDFVRDALRDRDAQREQERKEADEVAFRDARQRQTVLAIAVYREHHSTRIHYRVYDQGGVAFDEEVVRRFASQETNRFTLHDFEDIIAYVTYAKGFELKRVGISVPGIVDRGKVYLRGAEVVVDIAGPIEERFGIPCVLVNNVNAAALAWYSQQDRYRYVTFHSQPRGGISGGQGMVANGQLIYGNRNAAGEVNALLHLTHPADVTLLAPRSLESAVNIVVTELVANIAVFAPEVICLRSDLTPDMDELRSELAKYVPEMYLPDLIHMESFDEYSLHGAMQTAICAEGEEAAVSLS